MGMMAVVGCLAWSALDVARGAVEHERVIEATHLMAEVVAESIAQTGQWPQSESDLDRVGPKLVGGSAWPDDKQEVLGRVVIDYGLDVADVAKVTKEEFRAIRPADPEQESAATRNAYDRLAPALKQVVSSNP